MPDRDGRRSGRGARGRTGRWRVVMAALLVAGILLMLPASRGEAHTCTPDASVGVSGRLVIPRASGIAVVELPGRDTRAVPITPSQGVTSFVAAAPGGDMLAVARFWRPPADRVGGQDILLMRSDGGEPVGVVSRSQPGEVVGAPAWLADGSLLYERRQLNDPPEAVRIERVHLDPSATANQSGPPSQLVTLGGAWPSPSPDGAQLVMVRSSGGERVVLANIDGSDERVLVDRPELLSIAFPRFSPDGRSIAFAAATDPASNPTARRSPGAQSLSAQASSWGLTMRLPVLGDRPINLGATSVRAHGIPWDVWTVRTDGSGLQRLTSFQDDDSSLAWSPDGRHIATLSAEAIHVVSLDGTESYCISAEGGYGGVEWLR